MCESVHQHQSYKGRRDSLLGWMSNGELICWHSTHRHGHCTLNLKAQVGGSKIKIESVSVPMVIRRPDAVQDTEGHFREKVMRIKEMLHKETPMTEQKDIQILSIAHLMTSFQNA